jgi:pimeloyl-ACP methyl ester carboxylesterase
MTIVFVHGNPETDAIWDPLLAAMGRSDAVTLSPPGFGAPLPDDFDATSDSYARWLVDELEKFDAPVDLVGHDWGGGHVLRALTARPDLVNRWSIDIAGCFDPEYVWHDMAQVWQTAGEGEAAVAMMAAVPPADAVGRFESLGMTPEAARSVADAAPLMGRAILALYRSARQPQMHTWGLEVTSAMSAGRSLVIVATEDHYTRGPTLAGRMAERWGSSVATLEGLGHWWMLQDPARGAAALNEFFS